MQQKKTSQGLRRLWSACRYSLEGLNIAWYEPAFRQEMVCAIIMIPLAFLLGQSWTEAVLLILVIIVVLVVELLNTGLEKTLNRVGEEWHILTKQAKDMGSAAVLLSLLLCLGVWLSSLWRWIMQ